MNATQLITITVAALLLIGGATAVGAAAPADTVDTASNTSAEHTDTVESDADSHTPATSAAGVGPSGGLPEQVPDHVRSILDTIQSFQDGEIANLGEALSGLLGGGPAENAGNASA